jgi:hypothetical protein
MSEEIDAALKRAIRALIADVQTAVIHSRLTRWRDVFLVGRIVNEEVERYSTWGYLIAAGTLQPATPPQEFVWIVERCLQRIGEERGLSDEAVEAAIERVTRKRDTNAT